MKSYIIIVFVLFLCSCSNILNKKTINSITNCISTNVSNDYSNKALALEKNLIKNGVLKNSSKEAYLKYVKILPNNILEIQRVFKELNQERPRLSEIYQIDTCCRNSSISHKVICKNITSILDSRTITVNNLKTAIDEIPKEEFDNIYLRSWILFYSEMILSEYSE